MKTTHLPHYEARPRPHLHAKPCVATIIVITTTIKPTSPTATTTTTVTTTSKKNSLSQLRKSNAPQLGNIPHITLGILVYFEVYSQFKGIVDFLATSDTVKYVPDAGLKLAVREVTRLPPCAWTRTRSPLWHW